MLQDREIEQLTYHSAYMRGLQYYEKGAVTELSMMRKKPCFQAMVRGTEDYHVMVELDEQGEKVMSSACDCPAAFDLRGACKHVVAACLAIQQIINSLPEPFEEFCKRMAAGGDLSDMQPRRHSAAVQRLFDAYGEDVKTLPAMVRSDKRSDAWVLPSASEGVQLVPRLFISTDGERYVQRSLGFRIGKDKLYVLRDMEELLRLVHDKGRYYLGKNSGYIYGERMHWADDLSRSLYGLVEDTYHDDMSVDTGQSRWFYTPYSSFINSKKEMQLSDSRFRQFLAIMNGAPFEMRVNSVDFGEVRQAADGERPAIEVNMNRRGQQARLKVDCGDLLPLDQGLRYLYQGQRIYEVDDDFVDAFRPLWQVFASTNHVDLEKDELGQFYSMVLPRLEALADVSVSQELQRDYRLEPLVVEMYLDYMGDGLSVRPEFRYGDYRYNPLLQPQQEAAIELPDGQKLIRDIRNEREFTTRLVNSGFRPEHGLYVQPDEDASYDFLNDELPNMPDYVDVFYADSFQEKPVRPLPHVTAGVSVNDSNLLEVTFDTSSLDLNELLDILDSYRKKRRYFRLKDKSFISLSSQQLAGLASFAESTGLTRSRIGEGSSSIELPLSQAMYIDELARADESLRLERSKRFRSIVRSIRRPEDVDVDVPESLTNVLRDYQVTGFTWLSTLAAYGLGGILADDMGLGKTLQVIAFLLSQQDATQPPSLVVAPTSLVYNWLDEIKKFTPALKTAVVAGTKAERRRLLDGTDDSYDVLITTYNMLKRDIDLYEQHKFRYCILDEAQHIKNPSTQNARAVKRIKTSGYFALTGTPIENTLTELWSIFDFLMPGYLLSHEKFKQRYETPIVRDQDERAMNDLRYHVMPFILRRMKKDVLKELPDKVERKMVSDMTPKQEKVYQAWFLRTQKDFAAELAAHGFGESRIKILALLTRLRQIACDPSLFLEDYEGGSGKLDMLGEIVDDAVTSGHRLLIFSQFTGMLAHIGKLLHRKHVDYFYLDGSTPALERIRLVKAFNEGKTPAFLISLKAGGTGLNLTGADMVIHFDPWWNPAVEDQATDRAYRIGQKNNVQVLKLIARGTVEEKIYDLQQKKKSLIDQMIKPGENFLTKLTEQEIRELFEK